VTFELFVTLVFAGALAVSGVVLAFVPLDGRPRRQRVGWWLAGFFIPVTLMLGSFWLGDRFPEQDGLLAFLGFSGAFVMLWVGNWRTPDRPAWWVGNSGVALGWLALVVIVMIALSQLGRDGDF
jgi:hypothetical protein